MDVNWQERYTEFINSLNDRCLVEIGIGSVSIEFDPATFEFDILAGDPENSKIVLCKLGLTSDFAEKFPMFFGVDEDDFPDLDKIPSEDMRAGAEYQLRDLLEQSGIVVEEVEILIFAHQVRMEERESRAEWERLEYERMTQWVE